MKIVGANIGMTDKNTAFVCLDLSGPQPVLIDSLQAEIEAMSSDGWFIRAGLIGDQFRNWLSNMDTFFGKPDGFALETVYVGNHPLIAVSLGTLGGVLAGIALDRGIPVVRVQDDQAKTTLTGNARAGKQEMREAVRQLLGENFNEHIANAIGVALHGQGTLRQYRLTGEGEVMEIWRI